MEYLQPTIGFFALLFLGAIFSENIKAIKLKYIVSGVLIQLILALLLLSNLTGYTQTEKIDITIKEEKDPMEGFDELMAEKRVWDQLMAQEHERQYSNINFIFFHIFSYFFIIFHIFS